MRTAAELARTAVACARTGALVTFPRYGSPVLTNVCVRDGGGSVGFSLLADNPAARVLSVRPLASVRMAPAGCEQTSLQGTVRRLDRSGNGRTSTFVLDVGSVRVGRTPVSLHDYRTAEPDPLREDAPAIIEHLHRHHARELLDCLRAQGHGQARWVEPRRLDRYGLEVTVLSDEGVATVNLAFPAPIGSIEELGPGLLLALRGRCHGCHAHGELP